MISREKLRDITEKIIVLQEFLREPEKQEDEDHELETEEEEVDFFDYDNLFISEAGKKYYHQVIEFREFTVKGIIFSRVVDINKMGMKAFTDPDVNDLVKKSLQDEELEKWNAIKSLVVNENMNNLMDPNAQFTSDDRLKLIGSLVLATYSFCEVFIEILVERAFKVPRFGERYLDYLEKKRGKKKLTMTRTELEKYSLDPNDYIQTIARQFFDNNVKRNPYDKQMTILAVLGIRDDLQRIFADLDEKNYVQEYESLKELRNLFITTVEFSGIDPSVPLNYFCKIGSSRFLYRMSDAGFQNLTQTGIIVGLC